MNGIESDINTSRLFAELAQCIKELGAQRVIDNLRDMRIIKDRNNPRSINFVIAVCAGEFDLSIDYLANSTSYGDRLDCIRVISYLLYDPEDSDKLTMEELVRMLPWPYKSPSTIHKHRKYIENLNPRIPHHQQLLEKLENIKTVLFTTQIDNNGQDHRATGT